ncbi:K+ transporter 1 [Actinidia rufa]|uniref:K+ transporter 1 n=1 Tax=Actinidia rufa TaxID=165716 RepID=A0A7J0E3D8_9ERIC|nr:K+ transporter 1 [Actinidia rufa]
MESQIGYWIQAVLTTCAEIERCSLHMQHARDVYGWRTTQLAELLANDQSGSAWQTGEEGDQVDFEKLYSEGRGDAEASLFRSRFDQWRCSLQLCTQGRRDGATTTCKVTYFAAHPGGVCGAPQWGGQGTSSDGGAGLEAVKKDNLKTSDYPLRVDPLCDMTSRSITTLAPVGYGDQHPVNLTEMNFVTFYMLFNLGLNRYTIQATSNFSHRNQLQARLQDQMLAHWSLKFRTDSEGLQQKETLDSLPKAIRSSISHFLFYPLTDSVYLFCGVSNDLLFQLVLHSRSGFGEYFPPKEDVILQNEAPTDVSILVSGAVVVGEAQTGDVCGEIGGLCYRPQLLLSHVLEHCSGQCWRRNHYPEESPSGAETRYTQVDIYQMGANFVPVAPLLSKHTLTPNLDVTCSNSITSLFGEQHLKELKDPMMEGVLLATEKMLAQGRMDLPLSLCFATLREDDLLLQWLLRRGLDLNESDNNGRTALHMAASKGSESCVLLFLDYGADPNSRVAGKAFTHQNSEGNAPLWEAIMANNEPVVKLLADNVPPYLTATWANLRAPPRAEQLGFTPKYHSPRWRHHAAQEQQFHHRLPRGGLRRECQNSQSLWTKEPILTNRMATDGPLGL